MRGTAMFFLALTLAACTARQPTSPPEQAAIPFNSDIPVAEVMAHVLDPAADQMWSAVGIVYDVRGEHDLTPRTDAGWQVAENGAATVAIATNTLLTDGYQRAPKAQWNAYAARVGQVALRGKLAAEHHDRAALALAGSDLDAACEACHTAFIPKPTQP